MLIGKIEPAYVTAVAGMVTEFVSAIFFYLYNKTNQSMESYHNKLILEQNVSMALQLSDSLGEDTKDAVKKEIILELIKDTNQLIKSDQITKD